MAAWPVPFICRHILPPLCDLCHISVVALFTSPIKDLEVIKEAVAAAGCGLAGLAGRATRDRTKETVMNLHRVAGAAYRALTARKDGPSLYDVCDPLLLKPR